MARLIHLTSYWRRFYMSSNVDFQRQNGRKKVLSPIENPPLPRCIGLLRLARYERITRGGVKTVVARRMGKNGGGGQERRQGGRLCPRQRRAEERNRKSFQATLRYRRRAHYR